MGSKKMKQIVIGLIANDLIHSKLLLGLHRMHIDAGRYHLYLSDVIFRLMGFREKDLEPDLFEEYSLLTMNAVNSEFSLDDLEGRMEQAKKIYDSLQGWLLKPKK